ncbi:molybdate ABC transporter substrate-binding protein [Yoonia sp.]|uniref:molybdate ABC transporter substrate-binding protein n=1 Tax=Yoonia sp. TaxID=2212373 RepID=UPI0019FE8E0A|nr:molybdate ABC transporter substrate-binding protein [Yoonia sp.]MBE0414425.1 molybdate ABC transporter substrate-binding protein [Yoonia sp.]
MDISITRRVLLAAAFAFFTGPGFSQADAPVIAAAANMQFAVIEIAESFTAETGMQVRLSFGSTGNLSRQISEGAPFELLLAADDATPLLLDRAGLTRDAGRIYALGRIVLVAPNGSSLDPSEGLDGVRALLDAGGITRFAIANPDHAPFGIAARAALMSQGLWEDLQPVLVLGENVSQAAQFALSGNAEGGIIAYSLARAPEVAARGTYALIPEDWHEPLRQRMVLLNGAGEVAAAFYAYMNTPAAREIMQRYGFVLPQGE